MQIFTLARQRKFQRWTRAALIHSRKCGIAPSGWAFTVMRGMWINPVVIKFYLHYFAPPPLVLRRTASTKMRY